MTWRLRKVREPLKEFFVYIWMHKSGGKQGGSKTFQKRYSRNRECFQIPNLLNTKFAKIIKYQPHGGSNHLLSVKSIKIEKERGVRPIKLFQLVQLVDFNIYMSFSILKEFYVFYNVFCIKRTVRILPRFFVYI